MVTFELDGGALLLFLIAQTCVTIAAVWRFSLKVTARIARLEGYVSKCLNVDAD
jgi:hypothetical protein